MNSIVDLLACPMCKLGLDDLQARAMEFSIYFMLALIYSLAGIIGFKIYRMMAREEREQAAKEAQAAAPKPAEKVEQRQPEEAGKL